MTPASGIRFQDDDTPSQSSDKTSTVAATEQIFPSNAVNEQEPVFTELVSPVPVPDIVRSPTPPVPIEDITLHPADLPTPVTYPADTSPGNAAYETALNVLCSLGNDHFATPSATSHVSGSGAYFGSPNLARHAAAITQVDPEGEWLTEIFPNCAHLPQDRIVQTLRHYRYNIAPWVSFPQPAGKDTLTCCR